MNSKVFSFRLYMDALKQLRLIGITATAILVIEAILIPIGYYLSTNANTHSSGPLILGFFDLHPLLVFAFIIVAPLLTLYLFSFLNKRNSSDFYHSIPHSRTSLFLSYFTAVLSWIAIVIAVSSAVSFIAASLMQNYYSLNIPGALLIIFNIFSGSLFVAACVLIAMCITGTVFNNVIVSGMIIFVPRIIIMVILGCVTSALPLISSNNFIPILDAKYNVVFGFISSLFGLSNGPSDSLTNVSSGIYTLIVGLIFTFIATLLFRIRKSESAGFSAPNKALQSAYRIIIALIICLFPIYLIFQDYIYKNDITAETIFQYVIFYIIAIIAFAIYELITTRKWSNLVKAAPSLIVLAILNVVILAGIFGIYNRVLSYTPDADEIDSIQIISNEDNYYGYDPLSYFTKSTDKIKIDNPAIKQVVSDNLKSATEKISDSVHNYRSEFYNNSHKTIAIHDGIKTTYRNIIFNKNDMAVITRELSGISEYVDVYLDLPEISKNNTSVSLINSSLSEDSTRLIYNTFRDEVAKMDFEEFYNILNNQDIHGLGDSITFSSNVGTSSYSATIPIAFDFTKTLEVYVRESNKHIDKYKDKLIDLINFKEDTSFSVDFVYFNRNTRTEVVRTIYWDDGSLDNSFDEGDLEILKELINVIKDSDFTKTSLENNFLQIGIWLYNDNKSNNYYLYIPVENESDIDFLFNSPDKLID